VRVLVVTKIFPSAVEPSAAAFNRQQIAALSRLADVEVLATVPTFPFASAFGERSRAGRSGAVPRHEIIDGVEVHHPRYLYAPKVSFLNGPLYAASLLPEVLRRRGQVDVVLGTWAYPDGFASVLLGRALSVPVVVKLHGSDINVLGTWRTLRPQIAWTLRRADAVVAVGKALADTAAGLGAPRRSLHVVMNGVDVERFYPADRAEARRSLDLPEGRTIVYVGRLEKEKGVVDLLDAFAELSRASPERSITIRLVLVGDGAARALCEERAKDNPLLLVRGPRPHDEIPLWMRAADVVCLPSHAEGTPNVVLEALASGRRVVATDVGGIPALVHDARLGELVPPRRRELLAAALQRAVLQDYDPEDVAALAGCVSWDESARRLHDVLLGVIGQERPGPEFVHRPAVSPPDPMLIGSPQREDSP
jgi:teichuronic acid biosynthesis glycosyltransferase TuaC